MELPFWEQPAYLFITELRDGSDKASAHTGTVAELYALWAHLLENARQTANMRLQDRSLLEAEDIAGLAQRQDFPF